MLLGGGDVEGTAQKDGKRWKKRVQEQVVLTDREMGKRRLMREASETPLTSTRGSRA